MNAFVRTPKKFRLTYSVVIGNGCGCQARSLLTNGLRTSNYALNSHYKLCEIYSIPQTSSFSQIYPISAAVRNTSEYQNLILVRGFALSSHLNESQPLKPSSKVEETVKVLKDEAKEATALSPEIEKKVVKKKSIKQKVIDELVHYYHGFRLLFIDIKVSASLMRRVLNGETLTRREHRLLVRTVGDIFRLIPFSVFIIVPFMEFLLPLAIKLFPGMLPSTFQTATEKDDKMKQALKVKLEMAKFLQKTLDDMAVQHKDHKSFRAKEFSEFFHKVRDSGHYVTNEEIMRFSKLFEDEITLDSLSRNQLVALCRVLEVQTLGTNNLLRFQLRMKLRSLAADDKLIQKEGVDSLTLAELQQACRARGMRAYGMTEEKLRTQLTQWLDLSLNEKVPPSLLLLSRALMLPETIPTTDKLKATISVLPDVVATQTKAAIGEKEGKIDNKVKLEVLQEEVRKVQEERMEAEKEKQQVADKEKLVDQAPVLDDKATILIDPIKVATETMRAENVKKKGEEISTKDLEDIENALDVLSKDKKKMIIEKEEIKDLKEEMADYQEDLEDLHKVTSENPDVVPVKESRAAKNLYKKVNKMIVKMDSVLEDMEKKRKDLKEQQDKKDDLVKIEEIVAKIKEIKNVTDESRLQQIQNMLGKMDNDQDGSVKIEDVLKVIDEIGNENVELNPKQLDELLELLSKEEILEVEEKIIKALKDTDSAAGGEKIVKAVSKEELEKNSNGKSKDKPDKISDDAKVETKSSLDAPIIPPPPPINSIENAKKQDSKTL